MPDVGDEPQDSGQISNLISEFFQDFISRIVPGSVVIGLYSHESVKRVVDGKDGTLLLSLALLVIAWVVGVSFDLGVYTLGWPIRWLLTRMGLSIPIWRIFLRMYFIRPN